jgi:uncharacterized protein
MSANAKIFATPVAAPPTVAWWRLPIVWLVIGGPTLVVVASFITLTLAIQNPDPVLNTPAAKSKSEQPAVQGRNHAATPGR